MKIHDLLRQNNDTFIQSNSRQKEEIKNDIQENILIKEEEGLNSSYKTTYKEVVNTKFSHRSEQIRQQSIVVLQIIENKVSKYSKIALATVRTSLYYTAKQLHKGTKQTGHSIHCLSLAITSPINRFMNKRLYPVVDNFLSGDLS